MAMALLLLLIVLLSGPVPVRPHAIVLESTPVHEAVLKQPPARVVLRFNSKIERSLTRVTLARGDGPPRPLTIGTNPTPADDAPDRLVVPLPPLAAGVYVLRYRVLSADGHITEGALRFSVVAS